MTSLIVSVATQALPALLDLLYREGRPVAPRGLATREVCDVTVTVLDPTRSLLTRELRPNYQPAIGAAEGLLLLAGVSDPRLLSRVASAFDRFRDGGALHGAYGPRLRHQLPAIVERLRADPDTRQAVATVWDPAYDLHTGERVPRDLPCTVSLGFRVRDGALTLKTHMRSNDVWRGWCYDLTQFALLQTTLARTLALDVGPYVHHVDSLHLYETDQLHAQVALQASVLGEPTPRLGGLPRQNGTWTGVQERALRLLYGGDQVTAQNETETWLLRTLAPYL